MCCRCRPTSSATARAGLLFRPRRSSHEKHEDTKTEEHGVANDHGSRLLVRLTIRATLALLSISALLFGLAGRLDWAAAWWLIGILTATSVLGVPWIAKHDPDLMHERMSRPTDAVPRWDRLLLTIYRGLILAMFVTAALDAGQYRWSRLPLLLQIAGGIAVAASFVVIWRCLAVNHFLASYARLQPDRGQSVVQSGPYRVVRHPMYTAIIAFVFGTVLLLGSWLALVFAVLIGALFVVRTRLEDRMLSAGLEGYRAYAARVPNRLVPGVW
jgi:protein-S-isoprenylcysteine O-methyltransferase Ste14